MTREELDRYIADVIAEHRPAFFIERFFRTNEEWDRIGGYEFRSVRLSAKTEATLDGVLAHRSVVLLGEPGSGKSTVAGASIGKAAAKGWVPLCGSLRSYAGDLNSLLADGAPTSLVAGEPVDGTLTTRVLILDGFDEIPHGQLDRFVADVGGLLQHDSSLRLLLTSRQAYYETNRSRFTGHPEAFYLLDFSQGDIRQYLTHHGGNYEDFMTEVSRVEVTQEITNPFALGVLFRVFQAGQSLGRLRYEAVDCVVESLIKSRPEIAADLQRRALRMVAVAMETAARNELTLAEAVELLQSATRLSAPDAEDLLRELTKSILVRTNHGISFQMRSCGEYLAAVELRDRPLERVLSLVHYEGSLLPNESWRNCITYLAELHSGVKHHFAIKHPDWMMPVSPAAFSEAERTDLLKRLLRQLIASRRYLWHHPALAAARIVRFLTSEIKQQLLADAVSVDVIEAANAIVLLGAAGSANVIQVALLIALDKTRPQMFRASAIAALAHAGDASLIPGLIAALDDRDPLYLSLLDCIGTLTDAKSIPTVLPLLLKNDAMISGAFYRFQELPTVDAIDQLLNVLTADPKWLQSPRLDAYAKPLWEAMPDLWQPGWAGPLAQIIVELEDLPVYESDLESLSDTLKRLGGSADAVSRRVLQVLLAGGHHLFSFLPMVFRMVSPAVARWLATQPKATDLMQVVATFAGPEVREILAPHIVDYIEAQAEATRLREQEQREQAERERQKLEERSGVIRSSENFPKVLGQFSQFETKDWPDLSPERTIWISEQVQRLLIECDPVRTIIWQSETQLTLRSVLPLLIRITDRYGLHLEDDTPLVQSLLGLECDHIASCHRRDPFSAKAIAELERLLGDAATPNGAMYNFLGFLSKTELRTDAIIVALMSIAEDAQRPDNIRSSAVRCCKLGASEEQLVALGGRLGGPLKNELEEILVERQHRPTIERLLAELIGNPVALTAGESAFPYDSCLSWMTRIATTAVWPKLVQLRKESLQLALGNVASLLTETMNRIDGLALAAVVRDQVQYAPQSWQEIQYLRAFEIERDARLKTVQTAPFDQIIHRLRRATTLGLFKIWCEGPTDAPTIAVFVAKLPGANRLGIVTDSLKGWTAIMNPAWTADRLADGCHDLIVLLDGDKARDWAQPGHPIKPDAQRVLDKLTAAGVDAFILERFGIENYFSQAACEAVLGGSLAGEFPLPLYSVVHLPNLTKNKNPEIARAMILEDLANTDLRVFLETVQTRSEVHVT